MSHSNHRVELHLSPFLSFVGDVNLLAFSPAKKSAAKAPTLPSLYIYAPVAELPYLYAVLDKLGFECYFNAENLQQWQGVNVCFFKKQALSSQQLQSLQVAEEQGVQVCSLQSFIEERLNWVEINLLDAEYLLEIEQASDLNTIWPDRFRRVFDLLIGSLLLILLMPLFLPVALAIRLESKGPIFFKQLRTGLYNQEFKIIKFRSMYENAESNGAQWACKNDKRVTRVGQFIRKTRLDELPQLFNVLKGEMSLIGPRPEREVFIKDLETAVPFYRFRHLVKPGITGLAQVMYRYGASVEDARYKHRYDLYYIRHRSWYLDLKILLKTVRVAFTAEGI
ncbi:MAG: sugar transferase [Thiolinea sp.]